MAQELPGWMNSGNLELSGPVEQMDRLLTTIPTDHYAATETYWFNFCIPEERITGEIYLWVHSNLSSSTAGVWLARGLKTHHLQCEHFNLQHYLPYPTVEGERISVPEAGLSLTRIEPMMAFDIAYEHAASNTRIALRFEGTIPCVVRGGRSHYDQPGHFTGEVTLDGRSMKVDCYGMRDRSWGKPRMESILPGPPLAWIGPVFNAGKTAIALNGLDDPAHGVEWEGLYTVANPNTPLNGWVHRDGNTQKIVRMSKRSVRDFANMMRPTEVYCELLDAAGRIHTIAGRLIAGTPWGTWSNVFTHWLLMEWTLDDGSIGYGDCLDFFGPDFARRFS